MTEDCACTTLTRGLLNQAYQQASNQIETQLQALIKDQTIIKNNLKKHTAEMKQLVGSQSLDTNLNSPAKARMADLQDLIVFNENRLDAKTKEIVALKDIQLNKTEFMGAFSAFDPVWDSLSIKEQTRVIQLLIEQIGYDGENGKIL